LCAELIKIHKYDWNAFEVSWDFKKNPIIMRAEDSLRSACNSLLVANELIVENVIKLEEKVNELFIDSYGFSDFITPKLPIKQATLNINPLYRYSLADSDDANERLISDTSAELLSYSIGCIMGRYSLDREGLVYANSSNEGFKDLIAENAYQTFPSDDDGIVPLASEDWLFDDDATARFREFVKTVWGDEHLQEN
jgi:type II restriction/modification system DNA methylase subunit YeeA